MVAGAATAGAFVWSPAGGTLISSSLDAIGGYSHRGLIVGFGSGAWTYDCSGRSLLPRPAGAISLPGLGDGLCWDTIGLYTLGELRVVAVPEPAAWVMLLCGLTALRRRVLHGLHATGRCPAP